MAFDFGRPITNTRDEIILIKYRGCIKNAGELMFTAAKSSNNFKSYWLEKYPKFTELVGKSDEEIFNLLAPFTSAEFLKYMCASLKSFDMREMQTSIQDFADLMALSNPYNVCMTNFEIMLQEIMSYPFCKKVYIYDTAFSEVSKRYLREGYEKYKDKISLLEGSLIEIIDAKPDITTIFIDSSDEVCELLETELEGTDKFDHKQFMISVLPNIVPLTDGKSTFINQKFLSETKQRFKCECTWFQLKYVDRPQIVGPQIRFKKEN